MTSEAVGREELRELYKIAIDEYRFAVTLNWQRTQYYLALNAALITVGAGLVKPAGPSLAPVVAIVFGVALQIARIGRRAVIQGHEYYRRAIYKKTLIEHMLGRLAQVDMFTYEGANLSLATTRGMREATGILEDPEAWIRRESGPHTVTRGLARVMRLFMIIDLVAIVLCFAYSLAGLLIRP